MSSKIGRDKKKHFFVGIPLGLLLQIPAAHFFPQQHAMAATIGFVLLAAICYGFEFFSLVTGKGHADNLDAVAGILGGIIGLVLFWAVHYLK